MVFLRYESKLIMNFRLTRRHNTHLDWKWPGFILFAVKIQSNAEFVLFENMFLLQKAFCSINLCLIKINFYLVFLALNYQIKITTLLNKKHNKFKLTVYKWKL